MLTFHTFNCVILQKVIMIEMKPGTYNDETDLDLQKHLLLFAYKICTFLLLAWQHICMFGALKFQPIIKSSYH